MRKCTIVTVRLSRGVLRGERIEQAFERKSVSGRFYLFVVVVCVMYSNPIKYYAHHNVRD